LKCCVLYGGSENVLIVLRARKMTVGAIGGTSAW